MNDIVIVKDDSLPRNCWQLARISSVDQSKDGLVRTVQVTLGDASIGADGKRTRPIRTLERPIHKLVLLLRADAADADAADADADAEQDQG